MRGYFYLESHFCQQRRNMLLCVFPGLFKFPTGIGYHDPVRAWQSLLSNKYCQGNTLRASAVTPYNRFIHPFAYSPEIYKTDHQCKLYELPTLLSTHASTTAKPTLPAYDDSVALCILLPLLLLP